MQKYFLILMMMSCGLSSLMAEAGTASVKGSIPISVAIPRAQLAAEYSSLDPKQVKVNGNAYYCCRENGGSQLGCALGTSTKSCNSSEMTKWEIANHM